MNESNTPTPTETVTASQRRRIFQELIGADPENNHQLWSALDGVINAACDERDAHNTQEVARLVAHFPGLKTVLLLVWAHIQRTDLDPCGGCAQD